MEIHRVRFHRFAAAQMHTTAVDRISITNICYRINFNFFIGTDSDKFNVNYWNSSVFGLRSLIKYLNALLKHYLKLQNKMVSKRFYLDACIAHLESRKERYGSGLNNLRPVCMTYCFRRISIRLIRKRLPISSQKNYRLFYVYIVIVSPILCKQTGSWNRVSSCSVSHGHKREV